MNTTQNNLCIIPARGGSKRIPGKNIKFFLGKPIITYSIEAALQSGLFSDVMVSTDDEVIAAIAIEHGANVPFLRSEKTADDFATTLDVIKEVISEYQNRGFEYHNVCCVYATAPFVTALKLKIAYSKLIEQEFDSVLPVIKYSFPVQRSFEMNENSKIQYKFDEFRNMRSQDLTSSYHDAGQYYWMKKNILETDSIVSNNTGAIVINELEGQDIDDETDWKLAELKYKLISSFSE